MSEVSIKINEADPYAIGIRQFITRSFPNQMETKTSDQLDILTEAIIASGQIRFGPKPGPESLVAIRNVLRNAITDNKPVRIVSPWGSEKPNGSGVDIAELMALKTFVCLSERVKAHHAPGIEVRLRVEDAAAPHLFFERMEQARAEAKLYTDGFTRLNDILDIPWLTVAADSLLVKEEDLNFVADSLLPKFEQHLLSPLAPAPLEFLRGAGWQGGAVSSEMVEFYMHSYDKLYPGMSRTDKLHRVARYFAGSLARKQLGLSGALPEWGQDYMEIYFGTTPPGGRLPVHSRRVHYRVMPSSITSMHIAPWRAKGYMRVSDDGTTASVASWNDQREYNKFSVLFEREGRSQEVQADYIVQ